MQNAKADGGSFDEGTTSISTETPTASPVSSTQPPTASHVPTLRGSSAPSTSPVPTAGPTSTPSGRPSTDSATMSPTTSPAQWFMNWDVVLCQRDCEGEYPCGGRPEFWNDLYDTVELCCEGEFGGATHREQCKA